jgi:predicted RNA-binding Zn ribbon-like protein
MSTSAATRAERTPVPSEDPLPVRLMSTIWADADGPHDALRRTADVTRWLDAAGLDRAGAQATDGDLATGRALRDALRRLAAHITDDRRPAASAAPADIAHAVDQVNAIAAELPAPRLALRDGRLEREAPIGPSPVATALAQVAEQAVSLFGGDDATRLRACYAPGCVLYFVKTHPRREWCSLACGNRVRAARHYQRTRDHGSQA